MYDLIVKKMPTPDNWGQEPFKQNLKYQKFVGLRNMGQTCYMNSILQQFFMIPTLRYNFIGTERDRKWEEFDKKTTEEIKNEYSEKKKEELKKDNITDVNGALTIDNPYYQLQKLMSSLECSEQ